MLVGLLVRPECAQGFTECRGKFVGKAQIYSVFGLNPHYNVNVGDPKGGPPPWLRGGGGGGECVHGIFDFSDIHRPQVGPQENLQIDGV